MSQIVSTELNSVNLAREGLAGTALLAGPRYMVVRCGADGRYLDNMTMSHTAKGAMELARHYGACMDEVDPVVEVAMVGLTIAAVVPLAEVVV